MNPQLGKTVYFHTTMNGIDFYDAQAWAGNAPYGWTPISQNEYISGLNKQISDFQNIAKDYNWEDRGNGLMGWNKKTGQPYTGTSPSNVNIWQKQLSEVQSGQGMHSPQYVDPSFSKYKPDANTPSQENFTDAEKKKLESIPSNFGGTGAPISPIPPQSSASAGTSTATPPTNTKPQLSATGSLKVGSTGDSVKQLQEYLNSQGANLKVDGQFGPKTQEAVKQFQSQNGLLSDGVVGPKTISVINSAPVDNTTTNTQNTNTITQGQPDPSGGIVNYNPMTGAKLQPGETVDRTTGKTITPDQNAQPGANVGQNSSSSGSVSQGTTTSMFSATTGGISYDQALTKYNITPETWNKLSLEQQATISVALGASKALYSANANNVTLDTALATAAKDPTLTAKYADALKIDTAVFQDSLHQLSLATSTQSQQQQQQFEAERKALAEEHAAAGTAYSGYRKQAEQNLAKNEGNIVTSSRSQMQKNLQDLTTSFESKYGTAATPTPVQNFLNPLASSSVGVSGLATGAVPVNENMSGNLLGGIMGTAPVAKKQEEQALATNIVQTSK